MKKILALFIAALVSLGHAATLSPIQLLNPSGSTSGQAIVSTGPSTAPAWATVTAGSLTAITANSVYGNFTGASASPTANAMPSCSASGSALLYTTSTGFVCATGYAALGSPTFTGTPAAPTAATNTNTTQLATTAFVEGEFASPPSLGFGSTTPRPVAATTLSASSTISGAGFSTYLASPPAIGTTVAAAGRFTTLQANGALTPSTTAGIVGTTLADNATAGSVGEYVTATGTSISLTSGTTINIASINLTAGDWDVWGNVQYIPAGTTTQSQAVSSVNTTSATQSPSTGALGVSGASIAAGVSQSVAAPMQRINVNVTTTVYLVATGTFAVSTETASGFIAARRRR